MGVEVRLGWSRERRAPLASLLEALDSWAQSEGVSAVVVMDEAQELSKPRGVNVLPALAYAYDNLRRLRLIISGSETGLLYDFLRLDDPRAPLFGRYVTRVELRPFSREQAAEFLRRGFEELGFRFDRYDYVYERLGGVPGWLTYFGNAYARSRDLEGALAETLERARRLVLAEFENFLRVLARCGTWSDVKGALEAEEGAEVSDSIVYNYIGQLLKHSWITKEGDRYCPSEPLIAYSFS